VCGIAGIVYADRERPVDPVDLKAMGDAIAHRGPDAEGYFAEPGVGLVHRRLSIIDLEGGRQPLGNEDGSVQVVFNGEIYNHRLLRRELEARGHRFRTSSDTEVLAHLYEEDGPDLASRLRGMFAFAIWDRVRRRLVLVRDRLGIKPLYVHQGDGVVLFGSELKAILAHPGCPDPRVDPEALEDYLAYGCVPGPRSILQGIRKLPPAQVLVVEADQSVRQRRYWSLRYEPDESLGVADWCEAIGAKMRETVGAHLLADVPVGAFLSGGIDSGVVVALAAESSPDALRTFSIGFREAGFDELPLARLVAERYATRHVEHVATPDAAGLLDRLTHHFDEPFADSSSIPTYLVSQLAARDVKVALSGDGGDEAFGGYSRYAHDLREAALRRRLPPWFRRAALAPVADAWPRSDWLPRPLRAKTRLTNLALDPAAAYANTLATCRPPLRRRLLAREVAAGLNGHDPGRLVREAYDRAPAGDALAGMTSADVAMLLPDDFLVKVDRASMAHGLEVRPPMLDHELMELAARIPSRHKVRDGRTKWILKEALGERLPPTTLAQPKRGFEVPIDAWLRGPLRPMFEDAVLAPSSRVASLIDVPLAARLHRSHASGRGRHGALLWSLLVLARWADRHLAGEARRGRRLPEPTTP
jgi:asparagine synthase (glutamine-hydrolysing)